MSSEDNRDPHGNPPSFAPSRKAHNEKENPKPAASPSGKASPVPPSFAPSSANNHASRPQKGPSAPQATAEPSAQPAQFAPQAQRRRPARTSQSQSPVEPATSPEPNAAEPLPPSYAAASHGERRQRPARTASASSNRQGTPPPSYQLPQNHVSHASQQRQQTGNGTNTPLGNAMNPSGAGTATRTRKWSAKKIILTIVAFLVAFLLLLGFSTWNWVNGGLNRKNFLTDKPDDSAQTWLILGSDQRDGTVNDGTTGERTDTVLVLVKPKSGPVSMISIPRDSLVEVQGNYSKINAVYGLYGEKALVTEVEDVTGLKIDHVAKINFGGLTKVVDALGGVELCYDQDVNDEKSEMNWKAGCHTVMGHDALAFSRMRYSDPKGDFGRAERQRQLIGAIAKKGASASTLANPGKIKKVGDATLDSLTVDSDTNPMTLLNMLMAFRDASGSNGINGTVYWSDPDYYVDGVGSSVLLDNEKNAALFKQLGEGTHAKGTVGTLAENS